MLQVIVTQNTEQGNEFTTLDLYPNTQIDIVWENPFFLFDEISALFSLSFTLPSTPVNLSLFNYPNRIPILNVVTKFPAMIKHSGLQIAHGELLLFMYQNEIQTQFVGSVEITKRPLNELDLDQQEFDVDIYGVSNFGTSPNEINYSDAKWAGYKANALARSQYEAEFPYCIAPIKRKDTAWDGHEALFGMKNSLLQYINFFNAREKNFEIGNPDHGHTPVIPFPTVRQIVDTIFGDSLLENPFNNGDLANIVLVAPGHVNYNNELYQTSLNSGTPPIFMVWYEHLSVKEFLLPVNEYTLFLTLSVLGIDLTWQFNRFMPEYPSNMAIKDLLKIFGITLYRINRQFVMEFNNDIFDRETFQSWDDYLHGDPVLIREKAKNYSFTFSGEKTSFKGNVFEYESWAEAFNEATESQSEIEYFYKVTDSPQILSITKTLRGLNNQVWLIVKSVETALNTTVSHQHEETLSISCATKPLNMSIEQYWWQNHNFAVDPENPTGILWGTPGDLLQKGHWHVPVIEQLNNTDAPRIMLFAGRKPTLSATESVSLELSAPQSLTAITDPLNANQIILSFTDANNFEAGSGPESGYCVEYTTLQDSDWFFYANLYAGTDWNASSTNNVELTMLETTMLAEVVEIRVWAFSGSNSSPLVRIEVNGSPVTEGNNLGAEGDEYPYLTNHHTDHNGNRIFDFSLIPDAPDSFLEVYHNKMKQWVEQENLRVQATFVLSAIELMKIDMRDKVLLHGRKFFIEKLQFTLTPTHINATEATLISCLSPDINGSI